MFKIMPHRILNYINLCDPITRPNRYPPNQNGHQPNGKFHKTLIRCFASPFPLNLLQDRHIKKYFQDCNFSPSFMVYILGEEKLDKLLTLEALFISEMKPALNK